MELRHLPLVIVLRAYEGILCDQAAEVYRHELLLWKIETTIPLAKGKHHRKSPRLPAILRDEDG